jgi:REP element-mobilizing transposase RayT
MRSHLVQLPLAIPDPKHRGGARPGAGRKPNGARAGVSHAGRPALASRHPVHLTLRFCPEVWNLRSRRSYRVIAHALRGVAARTDFRAVHFSVQGNHVHLIAEASSAGALTRGAKALTVRMAIGLNRMMGRSGPVFADRYHAHVLRTPREVRSALAYVLLNHRRHAAQLGKVSDHGRIDPFSSGASFDGWRTPPTPAAVPDELEVPVSRARAWLLEVGWRRRRLIAPSEIPATQNSARRRSGSRHLRGRRGRWTAALLA